MKSFHRWQQWGDPACVMEWFDGEAHDPAKPPCRAQGLEDCPLFPSGCPSFSLILSPDFFGCPCLGPSHLRHLPSCLSLTESLPSPNSFCCLGTTTGPCYWTLGPITISFSFTSSLTFGPVCPPRFPWGAEAQAPSAPEPVGAQSQWS